MQVHYEGIHKIDPESGERAEAVDELQEAVVQCLDCMHDQPHLGFANGRVEPIEDRWERMIAGTPWVASCTVEVDAEDVESCSGPEAGDALSYAAFGDHGVREFFTHVRFHKHEDDSRIIVHLLVELYARSLEEATEVLEAAARGSLTITSLAEESRPPAAARRDPRSRVADRCSPRRAEAPPIERSVPAGRRPQSGALRPATGASRGCAGFRPCAVRSCCSRCTRASRASEQPIAILALRPRGRRRSPSAPSLPGARRGWP